MTTLAVLIQKEFRDAIRSRWLSGFGITFSVLALGISWVGSAGASIGGYSGFGRTTAALINLVLLIVPLLGLALGSMSISQEREKGTLAHLLALPLNPGEVFWSKFLGLSFVLIVSLGVAFGVTGLGMIFQSGVRDGMLYIQGFLATLPLALVSLSMGLLISSFCRKVALSISLTFLAWLMLVFGGDLGLLGSSLAVKLAPGVLLASTLLNPLSLYRIIAIDLVGAHLEMLGPAGHCAQDLLGRWLVPIGLGSLFFWIAGALAVSYRIYIRNPLREN